MSDFRRTNMQIYQEAVPKGSIEWHLRTLELAATGTGGRTPSSTVRYHVRQIRAILALTPKSHEMLTALEAMVAAFDNDIHMPRTYSAARASRVSIGYGEASAMARAKAAIARPYKPCTHDELKWSRKIVCGRCGEEVPK